VLPLCSLSKSILQGPETIHLTTQPIAKTHVLAPPLHHLLSAAMALPTHPPTYLNATDACPGAACWKGSNHDFIPHSHMPSSFRNIKPCTVPRTKYIVCANNQPYLTAYLHPTIPPPATAMLLYRGVRYGTSVHGICALAGNIV
jgi:hypothetical protein